MLNKEPKADMRRMISKHFFVFLLLILTISYFSFGTYINKPYKIESDGKYYYQYLVSAFFDHDFDFTNNYRAEKYEWMMTEIDHYDFRDQISPKTGKPVNVFTLGPAVLWSPFFLIARIAGTVLNAFHCSVDLNPWSKYVQYTTMYSAVVYTIIGLYLLYKLLTQYFSDSVSKIVLWIILMATPLYYYAVFEVSMSHVYDFFTFSLMLFLLSRCSADSNIRFFTVLGFVSALHVLIRTQNILTVAIFSCLLIVQLLRDPQRSHMLWMKLGAYFVTLVIGLLPIPLLNSYLFGAPFVIPQGNDFFKWSQPQVFPLLFSQRNGLFSHHPVLFLGLIGFLWLLAASRANTRRLFFFGSLLFVFFVQVYVNSAAEDWWAGHSFGQRRLLFSLPLFAFGMGYALERLRSYNLEIYNKFVPVTAGVLTLMGFYLTMIHVFLWEYDQPHNIIEWMFYKAPRAFF